MSNCLIDFLFSDMLFVYYNDIVQNKTTSCLALHTYSKIWKAGSSSLRRNLYLQSEPFDFDHKHVYRGRTAQWMVQIWENVSSSEGGLLTIKYRRLFSSRGCAKPLLYQDAGIQPHLQVLQEVCKSHHNGCRVKECLSTKPTSSEFYSLKLMPWCSNFAPAQNYRSSSAYSFLDG
jgi:hypothetical protein